MNICKNSTIQSHKPIGSGKIGRGLFQKNNNTPKVTI